MKTLMSSLIAMIALLSLSAAHAQEKKVLRAGMIGLDTSHVTAFTKILHDPKNAGKFGVRVVAGFSGGSKDIPDSINRVDKFTAELKDKYGVEIVDSIDELVKKVDVVFIESVDGRPHLQQLIPVLKAGKIVFIDKPMGGTLAEVLLMFKLSREYKTPIFSSSSLRYYPSIQSMKNNPQIGDIIGCSTYGPCTLESHHPDLFWYGVHGVEALFTIMGPGCKTVTRTHTKGVDLVTGEWSDGRIGTFRGIRSGKAEYGAVVFGSKGIVQSTGPGSYEPMLVEICKFFRTGQPPVSAEETINMFAFMEAADESKRQNGAPVSIESVLKKANEEMAKIQVK